MDTPLAPVKRMGMLRASYLLVAESFELFRKDAEIVWYAVLNAVILFVVAALFASGYFWLLFSKTTVMMGDGELFLADDGTITRTAEMIGYAALFVFYLISYFVTTYFGVALTFVVSARIEGANKGFRDGLAAANVRLGKIFGWALLASTVGLVLQIIADKASWVGRVFSWIGGVAWAVATFFIIPVLARENESVMSSVKRSGQTFVSTWGETLVMNFSLGLFFMILYLFLLVSFFAAATFLSLDMVAFILLSIALGIVLLVLAVLHAVLEQIFKVVLYEYATRGTIPDSFTPELIIGALSRKGAAPTA